MSSGPETDTSFIVERGGIRLDRLLASTLGCGRRAAAHLVDQGRVSVDGRLVPRSATINAGATVAVSRPPPTPPRLCPALARTVHVVWESRSLIALAKPAGLHTHHGRSSESVAAWLDERYPTIAAVGARRAESGLVHRLDRDTSGVVLAARDSLTYARLRADFSARRVKKEYLALVDGCCDQRLVVTADLARRRTRVVAARRRDRRLEAITHIEPLRSRATWSLVLVSINTGVTHQVRAHLALCGHSVLGDAEYGGVPAPAETRKGQLLHALRVALPDGLQLAAAPPVDFTRALAALRSSSRD